MKRKTLLSKIKSSIPILFFLFGFLSEATAQVSITSLTPYSQTFDGLPTTSATWISGQTLPNWYVSRSGTITANDGSTTATGLYSFGTTSATDRALGAAGNGTATSYGVLLQNNTTSTISSFTVQYALEMWSRGSGNKTVGFDFDYKKNETSLTATGYSVVAAGANSFGTGGGSGSTLDGNLAANRNVLTFIISGLSIAPGEKIMLRWTDNTNSDFNLALDDISITPSASATPATVYYSKPIPKNGTAYLNSLGSWTTKSDGTGINPTAFTNATFIITNQATPTINGNWTMGANAKAVVSDGNFTIPDNYVYSGVIDVLDNATLTINNITLPTLGTLGDLSTVIYNNQSQVTVPSADYGNLTINMSNKKLNAKTRVKKTLKFSGTKLDLNGYDLIVDENASIQGVGASAYVITTGNGRLKMKVDKGTQAVFPVGTANAYLPVTVAQSASATPDTFSVKAIDGVYQSYTNNIPGTTAYTSYSINKTWIIDEGTPGGSNVTLTLTWNDTDASSAGFNPNSAWIGHYTNGAWDNTSPAQATFANGVYSLSRSGITSFSPYATFSNSPDPLPIELVSFSAKRQNQLVNCEWQTAQEINNDFFSVERSTDGKQFTEITKVKGAGTTRQTSNYQYADTKAPSDLVYYRLRQTDIDGSTSFSKVVAVPKANTKNTLLLDLYPNPTSDLCYLKSKSAISGAVEIEVTNTQGKQILKRKADATELENGMPLSLKSSPKGIYFVTIRTNQEVLTLRTVRQ